VKKKKALYSIARFMIYGVSLVLLQRFCHRQTDGFSLYKISSNLTFHREWEVPALDPSEQKELSTILDQPYDYLAKGAQCYVFLSRDGNYVIKFFRIYHLQPPLWVTHLHWPPCLQSYQTHKILKKSNELHKDFESYRIAYDQLKEETGLLYLHLNKTSSLKHTLTLYDKIGVKHQVDLDQMEFAVQRRAELVYPALSHLLKTEGGAAAKEALSELISLLCLRCRKGIYDKDPDLNTNFGFIGRSALQIDIGRFRIENKTLLEKTIDRNEILRITDNLNQWLSLNHPELSNHLHSLIAQIDE
jgi:hypothetical protein